MTLLARLRTETRAAHEALEAQVPLTDPGLTLDDYAAVLRGFSAVVLPLERRLAELDLPAGLEWPTRERSNLLRRDLADLHAEAAAPAHSWTDLTPAGALGACYVLEGSTLGGQVIARHLRRLDLTPERGARYFAGHGADTGPRWKAFMAALEASVSGADADEVVAGADRTFTAFAEALSVKQAVGSGAEGRERIGL